MLKKPHPKVQAATPAPSKASGAQDRKSDPFIDALSEDTQATRPRTRALRAGRAGAESRGKREGAATPRVSLSLDFRQLPIPVLAGLLFALCVGLAMLLTPLIGRLVIGGRGLDDAMLSFAAESGVGAPLMAAAAPLLAMVFAVLTYLNARRRVERIAQSVSRALLVVLLTWMAFAAWATKLWCLPLDYGSCYSRILTVAGLLGGGPVLLAGLIGGYVMGRVILKRRAG